MRISNSSIRRKIFFSHISIIIISLILTFFTFNLCLNLYINKRTKKTLTEASKFIESSIEGPLHNSSSSNFFLDPSSSKLLDIYHNLKQMESFLDIKYIIVDKNQQLIYPKTDYNKDFNMLVQNIASVAKEKKLFKIKENKNSYFYFSALSKKYYAKMQSLKSLNQGNYLIVYSDLVRSNGFIKIVNSMLIIILVVTALITLLISNNLSKRISNPISQLINYAKRIGNRDYSSELIKYKDKDEIGELSNTLNSMAKKLCKYDNAMKTFLQNASHDLRTPLMSIQGYAEAVKYKVTDDEDGAMDIIIEESKRLSLLVDDLLYLSKIETMPDIFNFNIVKLQDIVNSSINKVMGIALKNNKTIKDLSKNDDIFIKCDEDKLIRALINILGNSLRYSNKNIYVTLKKEKDKIHIFIEDDGSGFNEEDISVIFNRFYKGKSGNYGLGLTIAKSIIEAHNGTIQAENRINGGAKIIITL